MYVAEEELKEQKAFTEDLVLTGSPAVATEMVTCTLALNGLPGVAVVATCAGREKLPGPAELGVVVTEEGEKNFRAVYEYVLDVYLGHEYGSYHRRWKDLGIREDTVPFRMDDDKPRKRLMITYRVKMKEENRRGLFDAFIERVQEACHNYNLAEE